MLYILWWSKPSAAGQMTTSPLDSGAWLVSGLLVRFSDARLRNLRPNCGRLFAVDFTASRSNCGIMEYWKFRRHPHFLLFRLGEGIDSTLHAPGDGPRLERRQPLQIGRAHV